MDFMRIVQSADADKLKELPVFINLSLTQYIQAAEELANAPAANLKDDSTRTGIECFSGGRNKDEIDYIYKIRWKSNYVNKAKFDALIPNILFEEYNKLYDNPSGEYCDLVVYVDDIKHSGAPKIVTFYPVTKTEMEAKVRDWKRYNDVDSVAVENDREAKLIIIENKDSKGKLFSTRDNPIDYRRMNIPNLIVVHPTSVVNRKTTHGKTDGSMDDQYKYNKGYYIDPDTHERVEINVDRDMGDYDIPKSSRVIDNARLPFEKAFWRIWCGRKGVTYRKHTIENMPCFWAISLQEAHAKLRQDGEILYRLDRWGVNDEIDYQNFENVMNNFDWQINKQWDK